jgi:glycosyltransferase involved in cell wall biosynthesis
MVIQKVHIFYEKNHLKHPFIKLLIKSLSECSAEIELTVVSFAFSNEVAKQWPGRFVALTDWIHHKADNGRPFKQAYGSRGMSLKLIKSALGIFKQNRPDVIISFLPIGFLAAQLYTMRRRCWTVYYPFELYGKQRSEYSKYVILAEILGFMLKPGAFITQNDMRANFYRNNRFCRTLPFIAHNYKERRTTQTMDSEIFVRHGVPKGKKVVLYQGMLAVGRWIDRLVQAAKFLDDDAVLVLMGPKQKPWWDDTISPLLDNPELEGRLFILESVAHEKVSTYASAAAAGVILYDDSVLNNIYCEPGKIGDFVHAGVPVVAPGFPSIKQVINEHNLGIVFEDFSSEGIANAMNEVLTLPKSHFNKSLLMAANHMNWEAQWPFLKEVIFGKKRKTKC